MAEKSNKREIDLYITPSSFESFFRKFAGEKKQYDFSGISDLRKVLNNEKARVLYTIKYSSPDSIYHLAKLLGRDFKSVRKDIKLLEKLGFVYMKPESTGQRKKLKPQAIVDELTINVKFR